MLVECSDEVKFFTKYYDKSLSERLINVVESDFAKLEYTDAIRILENANVDFEFPVYWGCDLKSEHERYITEVFIKNQYL